MPALPGSGQAGSPFDAVNVCRSVPGTDDLRDSTRSHTTRRELLRTAALWAGALAVGSSFSLPPFSPGPAAFADDAKAQGAVGVLRATNVMWSWWIHPVAVSDGAVTWVGGIGSAGEITVSRIEPGSARQFVVGQSPSIDDHNGPAIAFHPDRDNLLVFWAGHNDRSFVQYRTVNRDDGSLGTLRKVTFRTNLAYVQVIRRDLKLILFTRCPQGRWAYRVSEDFGTSWGPEKTFITAHPESWSYKQYLSVRVDPADSGQALFTAYMHPEVGIYRSIDAGRIDLDSGAVTTMSGSLVANLYSGPDPAFGLGRLPQVYAAPEGQRVRLLDTGQINGLPAVAYVSYNEGQYATGSYGISVYENEWKPLDWALASGRGVNGTWALPSYFGGIALSRYSDGSWCSVRQTEATREWVLEQWRLPANSIEVEFVGELARTQTEVSQLLRPITPVGPGLVDLLALDIARYSSYTEYASDVIQFDGMLATASVCRLLADTPAQIVGKTRATVTAEVITSDLTAADGEVVFSSNGTEIVSVPVVGGKAAYTLKPTATPGRKEITAEFRPTNENIQRTSTSPMVVVSVAKQSTSVITLRTDKTTQKFGGRPAKLTATVKSNGKAAAGTVTFRSGSRSIVTVKLAAGVANYTLKKNAAVGLKKITATYAPSSVAVKPSSSTAVTVRVNR